MFASIFIYELKYWIKQPTIYIYSLILLLVSMAQMGEWAGLGRDLVIYDDVLKMVNSPIGIYNMTNKFSLLIHFVLPIIFGGAIYRDYKSRVNLIIYTFPFTKFSYLSAKYLSALAVSVFVVIMLGIGTYLGN